MRERFYKVTEKLTENDVCELYNIFFKNQRALSAGQDDDLTIECGKDEDGKQFMIVEYMVED